MIFLKLVFDFYINCSIHVALAVFFLVRITESHYKLPYNKSLDLFIFFATITAYNFIKYMGVVKFHGSTLAKSMRLIRICSFICFCLSVYYGYRLPTETYFYLLPFAILTILYIIPFWDGFQKSLRKVSYLKIFLVAIVWSGVTGVLPLLVSGHSINFNLIIFFFQRFFFVLVLILPFEIRDMELDLMHIKTFPQKMGIKKTKKMGFIWLLFSLALDFFLTELFVNKSIFFWVCLVTLFFLMRAKEKQSGYYSSFCVESIPILWWILLLVSV